MPLLVNQIIYSRICNWLNNVFFCTLENKNENNSGVEFPGNTMEPYMGSSLTIDDHDFHQEVVIVEIS